MRANRAAFAAVPSRLIATPDGWLDLLNIGAFRFRLDTIAKSLAFTNRYQGHVGDLYSNAMHSLAVSWSATFLARAAGLSELAAGRLGLLHDGAEPFLGDVIGPVKALPAMAPFRVLERQILSEILRQLTIVESPALWAVVHDADAFVTANELRFFFEDLHPGVEPSIPQLASNTTSLDLFLARADALGVDR